MWFLYRESGRVFSTLFRFVIPFWCSMHMCSLSFGKTKYFSQSVFSRCSNWGGGQNTWPFEYHGHFTGNSHLSLSSEGRHFLPNRSWQEATTRSLSPPGLVPVIDESAGFWAALMYDASVEKGPVTPQRKTGWTVRSRGSWEWGRTTPASPRPPVLWEVIKSRGERGKWLLTTEGTCQGERGSPAYTMAHGVSWAESRALHLTSWWQRMSKGRLGTPVLVLDQR